MFELNGNPITLEQLQNAAVKYNMEFEEYLEKMKAKGLVEKEVDSSENTSSVEAPSWRDTAARLKAGREASQKGALIEPSTSTEPFLTGSFKSSKKSDSALPEYFKLNNDTFSLKDLRDAANKYDMDFDSYLEKMKAKGLVAEDDSSSQPEIKHASIDQMKEGVSWLQAEGDFVENMNKHYEGTGIIFDDAIGGADAFTMYDTATDETSKPIKLPKWGRLQTYHQGYGERSWDNVNAGVKSFIDRKKQEKPEFKEAKEKTENKIAEWLEKDENLTKLLGPDTDFDYIQPESRGGKGGVGEENDYDKVIKSLKRKSW